MKFSTFLACLPAILAGCNANSSNLGQVAPETLPATSRAAQSSNVFDRTQSSYLPTFVRFADGRVLTRGHAQLEVAYVAGNTDVKLRIEATGPNESWAAQIPLDAFEITSQQLGSIPVKAHFQRSHSGDKILEHVMGHLSLERTQVEGQRTVFHGRLHDNSDSLLAEFQTELDVRCAVPPEMVGGELANHGTPSSLDAHILVYDTELNSSVCSKFQSLL